MNKYETLCKKLNEDIKDGKRISPLKAIRCDCLECMGYQPSEVTRCEIKDCHLWMFRTGRNKTGGGRGNVTSGKPFVTRGADSKEPK